MLRLGLYMGSYKLRDRYFMQDENVLFTKKKKIPDHYLSNLDPLYGKGENLGLNIFANE